jgi:O-antigen/teichoic acid export membrane protein
MNRAFLTNYLKVTSGSVGRGAINAVYFLLLANTLTLGDFGVFATASAIGIVVSTFAGFGFGPILFRAATVRRHVVAWYMGAAYLWFALSLVPCLIVGLAIWPLAFSTHLTLAAFAAILVAEIAVWRLIDMIAHLNNGLGRYMHGALGPIVTASCRLVGVLLFWTAGAHDLEVWAMVYLAATAVALLAYAALSHPRIRPRLKAAVTLGHLPAALKAAMADLVSQGQADLDKVAVMLLAGDHAAGIYAIAMRLIDLTALPIRSFYILLVQRILRTPIAAFDFLRSLMVEAGIAAVSIAGFLGLMAIYLVAPRLLGANVVEAAPLFTALLAAPVFKNLIEYHSEILFAVKSYSARVVHAVLILAVKLSLVVALALQVADPLAWGLPVSLLLGVCYLLSITFAYWRVATVRGQRRREIREPAAPAAAVSLRGLS